MMEEGFGGKERKTNFDVDLKCWPFFFEEIETNAFAPPPSTASSLDGDAEQRSPRAFYRKQITA